MRIRVEDAPPWPANTKSVPAHGARRTRPLARSMVSPRQRAACASQASSASSSRRREQRRGHEPEHGAPQCHGEFPPRIVVRDARKCASIAGVRPPEARPAPMPAARCARRARPADRGSRPASATAAARCRPGAPVSPMSLWLRRAPAGVRAPVRAAEKRTAASACAPAPSAVPPATQHDPVRLHALRQMQPCRACRFWRAGGRDDGPRRARARRRWHAGGGRRTGRWRVWYQMARIVAVSISPSRTVEVTGQCRPLTRHRIRRRSGLPSRLLATRSVTPGAAGSILASCQQRARCSAR